MRPMNLRCVIVALLSSTVWVSASARGEIAESGVLVVYNSASADAVALRNSYLAAHPQIPAANVLDLNDTSLLTADISQADFVSKVRDPIRNYLAATGAPQPQDIVAIALLRPFPHRVLDTDNALVGDSASAAGNELSPATPPSPQLTRNYPCSGRTSPALKPVDRWTASRTTSLKTPITP
jgi:hypothetical protein